METKTLEDGSKQVKVKKGKTIQLEYVGKYMIEKGPYKNKEGHDMNILLVEPDTEATTPAEDFDL